MVCKQPTRNRLGMVDGLPWASPGFDRSYRSEHCVNPRSDHHGNRIMPLGLQHVRARSDATPASVATQPCPTLKNKSLHPRSLRRVSCYAISFSPLQNLDLQLWTLNQTLTLHKLSLWNHAQNQTRAFCIFLLTVPLFRGSGFRALSQHICRTTP